METRKEIDPLGEKLISKDTYYGIQTARAVENFPVSGIKAPAEFIKAYVLVKKAAALANMQVGWLDQKIEKAIVQACDEILSGKFHDQFVVDVFQAGAGTSFNMNVNEVLANRALEIMGRPKGDYKTVSPNDHVNMAQSTNDTFPTAIHIAVLIALQPLTNELDRLAEAFEELSKKHRDTMKSGRTHLQDAVPVTIGQEFGAYASAIKHACDQLRERQKLLCEVALGGTATGTGVNAHPRYKHTAIAALADMTGFPLKPASNTFEALQSCRPAQAVSSALKELALELIRVANDLRLLSSGPTTGLAEIALPPVQPGSSIMPGKVNPVMAECLDMVAFQVVGNDLAVSLAVQAGQLDLNVMTPVIMHNILSSIKLLTNYLPVFRKKCVEGITVDEKRCADYVDKNPSLATYLSPYIGYLEASKIAKQALKEGRSVKEIALEKGLLTSEELEKIFNPKRLINQEE
ncbi:aspartate ammonia-lyase [Candidatus Bathyarchaeota archaeon A05DMB-2]|nr:aspartate ammonia-lyase [Candidatus Bathyarchaeota archaeon A05DMB-2]